MVAVAGLGPGVPRVPRVGQARWDASPMSEARRLRNGGSQVVRVEHVHVNEGGQALIGNVRKDGSGGGEVQK